MDSMDWAAASESCFVISSRPSLGPERFAAVAVARTRGAERERSRARDGDPINAATASSEAASNCAQASASPSATWASRRTRANRASASGLQAWLSAALVGVGRCKAASEGERRNATCDDEMGGVCGGVPEGVGGPDEAASSEDCGGRAAPDGVPVPRREVCDASRFDRTREPLVGLAAPTSRKASRTTSRRPYSGRPPSSDPELLKFVRTISWILGLSAGRRVSCDVVACTVGPLHHSISS